METDDDIFIFECKLRGTADEALEQIHEREYAVPYRGDSRAVTLVGRPSTRIFGTSTGGSPIRPCDRTLNVPAVPNVWVIGDRLSVIRDRSQGTFEDFFPVSRF